MACVLWLPLDGKIQQNGTCPVELTPFNLVLNGIGQIGQCYQWNGNDSYLHVAETGGGDAAGIYNALKGGAQPFTFCWWYKINDTNRIIFFGDYGLSGSTNFNIEVSGAQGLRWYWGSPDISMHSTFFIQNEWTHAAIAYDGTKFYLYRNGISIGEYTVTLPAKTKTTGGYYLGRDSRTGATAMAGSIQDFRLYNECLSAKQIREISKSLILHYLLEGKAIEGTINYCVWPKDKGPTGAIGWQTNLHTNAYNVSSFSNGYNSGVPDAANGYHAQWNIIDNIPTLVFHDQNSSYGNAHRWLGVSGGQIPQGNAIPANTKYTISFDQKVTDIRMAATCGIYYRKLSSQTNSSFHDGCPVIGYNTAPNVWQRVSHTFTRDSAFDNNMAYQSIYVYGNNNPVEGIIWVRNIQLEIKDHATDFVIGQRLGTICYDTSGYSHNGIITGSLSSALPSARYLSATHWTQGNTNYIDTPVLYMPGTACTISFWFQAPANSSFTSGYHMPFESLDAGQYEISIREYMRGGLYINNTRYVDNTPSLSICNNAWHMLTMTYDGVQIKRYVDGIKRNTTSIAGTLNQIQAFRLGAYGTTTSYANNNCNVSDVRLYTTALTEEEVLELYNTSMNVDSAGNISARILP